MFGIDILGHDNLALAIQIDLIKEIYGSLPDIRIVSNIADSENVNAGIQYLPIGVKVEEIHATNWSLDISRKLIIGAMSGKTMKTIYSYFQKLCDLSKADFINLIHPNSYIATSAEIGRGILIEPNTSISSFAKLADYIWIKRNASIGHHTLVGSFTNINPGATIASCCDIGRNCLIGAGATISDKVKIGNRSIVGAGAVVIKDVPSGTIVVGNPAKVLKENDKY